MIGGETTSIRSESAVNLVDLVENNVSSIDMLSSRIGLSPEATQKMLMELVEEGKLSGRLTSDGTRFYKSDVKTSDAPTVASAPEPVIEERDTKPGIIIMLSGIIMFISGNILVNLNAEFSFLWSIGSAIIFLGPLVLIAGMYYVSRLNPPQKLG
ncbi:MAG: hypothetical protein ACFFFC_17360 [Candidatus Thorarchaeota archaeon]